jgi:hypothetical protein
MEKMEPNQLPVYGVDEYLSKFQAEHKDHIAARGAAKSPAAKKMQLGENTAPEPVAIGAKSSKHTILLNDMHQALCLPQPHFTFGGSGDSGWTAEVSFVGLDIDELQHIQEPGHFGSKQEAKEATSRRALSILDALQDEGRIKPPVKGKKKMSQIEGDSVQQHLKQDQQPVENYIGQLLGMSSLPPERSSTC